MKNKIKKLFFKEKTKKEKEFLIHPLDQKKKFSIILYNDEINTFEFVVETLMELSSYLPQQAEQCALIANYKGQCEIKSGSRQDIYDIYKELSKKGLKVSLI